MILFTLTLSLSLSAGVCPKASPSVRDEYRASDAVVVGTVIRATHVPLSRDYLEGTTYLVRVDETLKGKPPARIPLFSENSSARFPMRVGTKYLLFVDNLERSAIDNCGNSGAVSKRAKALALVRRLHRG
jgi:hypothetical protein